MRIGGIQKLSLLDYPEKLAATVFTVGCNLRCPFCHNAALVTGASDCSIIPEEEFFDFLKTRVGKLDGVCVTGGEPLIQDGLEDFIRRIRAEGFLVKLDTNGSYPEKLRELIDKGLLDYVAMDVKSAPINYAKAVGIPNFDVSPALESISILKEGRVPYEFRTTFVKGIHTTADVEELGKLLAGAEKYFLQGFVDSGALVGFGDKNTAFKMDAFSREELESFAETLKKHIKEVSVRG